MSSTVACVKPNPYLLNIENKKRKHKLAHEAGAGARCNRCEDKCPGFELHFWRKVCLNCRCSKDDHEIDDDDEDIGKIIIGKLFDRPIRTKAEEAEYSHGTNLEILNNDTGKSEKLKFDWVPPDINSRLASRYMEQLPVDKRPIAGTEAAKMRKKQLDKQVPIYDMDETKRSANLVEEELQTFQAYMDMVRNQVVGQGAIQELASLQPSYSTPLYPNAPIRDQQSTGGYPKSINEDGTPSYPVGSNIGSNSGIGDNAAINNGYGVQPLNTSSLPNKGEFITDMRSLPPNAIPKSPKRNSREEFMGSLLREPGTVDNYFLDNEGNRPVNASLTKPMASLNLNTNEGEQKPYMPPFSPENSTPAFDNKLYTSVPNYQGHISKNNQNIPGQTLPIRPYDQSSNIHNDNQPLVLPDLNQFLNNKSTIGQTSPTNLQNLNQSGENLPQNVNTIGQQTPYIHQDTPAAMSQQDPIYANVYANSGQKVGQKMPGTSYPLSPRDHDATSQTPSKLQVMSPQGRYLAQSEALQAPYNAHIDKLSDHSFMAGESDVNIQFPSESVALRRQTPAAVVDDPSCVGFNCQYCEHGMNPGDIAVICERAGPGKYWHPACFVCVTCKELLADMIYFYKDGNVYCGRHFANCVDIPRCKACDELIFGNSWTRADDFDWHLEHYCCFLCDQALAGQKYVPDKEGNPYCLACYMSCLARMCETCEERIGPVDKRCSHRGYSYHANDQCFSCHTCRKPLIGQKFKMAKNWLFCTQECANRAAEELEHNPNPKEKSELDSSRH